MFFFNSTYLIYMLPGLILVMVAQLLVRSTYRRWSEVRNGVGVTGAEAARQLLGAAGMGDIRLEQAPGELSDHYDPRSRTLRLSQGVGNGNSVAALAITAHEIGHALQDKAGYLPMRLRGALVPAVNIGSNLGLWLIIGSLILRGLLGTQLAAQVALLGLILFASAAVFALVTLPVELNASNRARQILKSSGLIQTDKERRGVSAVLNAAAFTYVAGLATAILQLLYWASVVGGMGRRRS